MNSFSRLQADSNKIGAEFLLTEVETAFTFLAVAETTRSAETRERNHQHACEAYKIAQRMQAKVIMDPGQKTIFQKRIADLRKRLEELGLEIS